MNINYDTLAKTINENSSLIGDRGVKRLLELATIENHWDGDDSLSMNSESLERMFSFLNKSNHPLPNDLGYFFDFKGCLIINWECLNQIVDLTFNPEATYLYVNGFDDGIALPECIWGKFNYSQPEKAVEPYQEKLEMISPLLESLPVRTATSLINSVTRDYGWGEHGDELAVKVQSLESLVLFFKQLEYIPETMYFYSNELGDIEAFWNDGNLRHELECIEDGVELFEAPEYHYTKVLRADFYKHKLLNEFLKEKSNE